MSHLGSMIGRLALPLTAVLAMEATPAQMGVLRAAEFAPILLVGLIVHPLFDRVRRIPVMIAAGLGRAVLLGSIPIVWAFGHLSFLQVFLVGLLVSALGVLYELALQSLLPMVLTDEESEEAEKKFGGSGTITEVGGFGVAGLLVQALGAPVAVFDAVMLYLLSLVPLTAMTTVESEPVAERQPADERKETSRQTREALKLIVREPVLRAIVCASASTQLFASAALAVALLFVAREVHIAPFWIGILFTIGGGSALLGQRIAQKAMQRWGLGGTLMGSIAVWGYATLALGAAGPQLPRFGSPLILSLALLCVWQILSEAAVIVFEVHQLYLMQAITPQELQEGAARCLRGIEWAAVLVGAIGGGVFAQATGLRQALLISAFGIIFSVFWLRYSPIRDMEDAPPALEAT